jgi:hypothetical protein
VLENIFQTAHKALVKNKTLSDKEVELKIRSHVYNNLNWIPCHGDCLGYQSTYVIAKSRYASEWHFTFQDGRCFVYTPFIIGCSGKWPDFESACVDYKDINTLEKLESFLAEVSELDDLINSNPELLVVVEM